MKIASAARKYGIARYQIEYWRKTGLIPGDDGELDFEDLLILKFIISCRKEGVSLQKIRNHIHYNFENQGEAGAEQWHNRLTVFKGDTLLLEDGEQLIHPDSGQVYFNFRESGEQAGELLRLNGDEDELKSLEVSALEEEFQLALSEEDLDQVENILLKIIKEEPDHQGALIELGNIAFENEDFNRAISYYEEAIKNDNFCVEAIYNIANLYFRLKKYAVAIRYYQQVIELDPEFPECYYNLGLVFLSLKQLGRARDLFEHYLSLDPGSNWSEQAEEFISDINRVIREAEESADNPELFNRR